MTTQRVKLSKIWHVCLWVAQALLAGVFLMAGYMKAVVPLKELSQLMPMAAEMPVLIRFIGVSELAGALGLILPAALRILPQLTIVAAGALAIVMLMAMGFHVARGESVGMIMALGVIALFIAWGRSLKAPIIGRTLRTNSPINT